MALFLWSVAAYAQSDDVPRADIVGCVRAVEGVEDLLRAQMQSHCLVLAGNHCEAPASGPILACLADVTEDMDLFVARSVIILPEQISGSGFQSRRYLRIVERLKNGKDAEAHCAAQHGQQMGRAICETTVAFGRLTELFNAARLTGVTVP